MAFNHRTIRSWLLFGVAMKEYNDCSTGGLLLSCQMFGIVKNQLDAARKNLRTSLLVFLVSFFIIITNFLKYSPGADLMNSDIISVCIFLVLLGGAIALAFNFKEFMSKKKLATMHKDRLYSDYRIYMIENDRVWFDIDGMLKIVKADEINDDFVRELLSSNFRQID